MYVYMYVVIGYVFISIISPPRITDTYIHIHLYTCRCIPDVMKSGHLSLLLHTTIKKNKNVTGTSVLYIYMYIYANRHCN